MKYHLNSTQCDGTPAIRTTCDFRLAAVEGQAQHLRSWAVVRGASITGKTVVRLHGDGDACSVMLPTAGRISPNLETGLTADAIEAGPAIEVDGVPFEQVQALVRALRSEFGAECGLAGWTEFRASPEGWKRGTVTWRVRSLPAALPESITVDETPAPAAVAIAADEPERLASRRFSIHWPRWRRQDS